MTKRACRPCTACCDGWVQMNINGVVVSPGNPCPHSTGTGCDDYVNRPVDPCHNFLCGWIEENSPLPAWMKPNKARVMVLFNKINWQGFGVDLAVPVGKRIPPRALNWLKNFAREKFRPLLYTEQVIENGNYLKQQETFGFGPPEFQNQLVKWQEQGKKLWE